MEIGRWGGQKQNGMVWYGSEWLKTGREIYVRL